MFDKFENWFKNLSDGRKLIVAFWLPFVLGVLLGLYPTVTIMCSKIEVLRDRIDADLKEGLEQTSEHKADNEPAPAEDATPQGPGLHILNEPETVRRDAVDPDGIRSDIGVNHADGLQSGGESDVTRLKWDLLQPVGNKEFQKFSTTGVCRFHGFLAHAAIVSNKIGFVTPQTACKAACIPLQNAPREEDASLTV